MTEPRPLVSIVVPFHNEEEGVERFYESLCSAVRQVADVDFEVVFVDDGSRDETLQRLIALVDRDPRVRAVELSRNFGKEAALSAGIDLATGDAVIPIDADLQDPPELIPAVDRRMAQRRGHRARKAHGTLVRFVSEADFGQVLLPFP
jgi:glycosyltransferase involved in cell wall biosynthesis